MAKTPRSWRKNPDSTFRWFPALPKPASLSPDVKVMDCYVEGNIEARAIIDSWAFRFEVTQVEEIENRFEVVICG